MALSAGYQLYGGVAARRICGENPATYQWPATPASYQPWLRLPYASASAYRLAGWLTWRLAALAK